jgi:hypothetical protein
MPVALHPKSDVIELTAPKFRNGQIEDCSKGSAVRWSAHGVSFLEKDHRQTPIRCGTDTEIRYLGSTDLKDGVK